MPDLPAGTVTFLFTDIEGSTRLLGRHPRAYGQALLRHDELMRQAVEAQSGVVFETIGDAVYAAFSRATAAVAAALQAQLDLLVEDWGELGRLRVRMAVHGGDVELRGTHYFGAPLYRCARLMAIGHGAQTLLSRATMEEVRGALPEAAGLRPLGTHRLKDLPEPEDVFELTHPRLPADAPPLRSLNARPSNLPAQVNAFVGRETERAETRRLLSGTRLLTLTGTAGTGKTRLALQVAADLLGQFDDGVIFVPLAAITDAALVASEVASALEVAERPGEPLGRTVARHLGAKELLLVLDNFEQVVEASGLVAQLLETCPRLTLLVTSQVALGIAAEQRYAVPPLGVAGSKSAGGGADVSSDAGILFLQRALRVRPDLPLEDGATAIIERICERLEGLPLAIELAAARVNMLSLEALLGRLSDRFAILRGGGRDRPDRHRSLRAAVSWSHDLLSEDERVLLRRLGVFVGGCALDEAEAVVGGEGLALLDGVSALADRSLVRQDLRPDGATRVQMLETIREYALERLHESGESDTFARRHARAYMALAERAEPELTGPRRRWWLDRLEAEHDNLRAALAFAVLREDTETALRMATALWRFWQMRGHLEEGWTRMTEVLSLPAREHRRERVRALEAAGGLAYWRADPPAATARYAEGLAIARELGDPRLIATLLYDLSFGYAAANPEHGPLLEESLALFRELGDRPGIAKALLGLGVGAAHRGAHDDAERLLGEGLSIQRDAQDRFATAALLHLLGAVAYLRGDQRTARARLEESLALAGEAGDVSACVVVLLDLSRVAMREGQAEEAARLAGAVAGLRGSSGVEHQSPVDMIEGPAAPIDLTDQALAAAWADGNTMTLEATLGYVLRRHGPHPRATVGD